MEWNGSSYAVTGRLEGLGVRVHPTDQRFSSVIEKLQNWMHLTKLTKRPLMILGTAQSGLEIRSFHTLLGRIQPPVAILVTPSEVTSDMATPLWTQHFWIDSPAIGDVLGGSWNVYLRTRRTSTLTGPAIKSLRGATIASRYEQLGRIADPDPPGRQVWYSLPYSVGVLREISTLYRGRECRVLSRNSHLAAQSLNDIWQYELQLPRFEDTGEHPTLTDQIVVFGGWKRWER